jgi:hypothetical protein
VITAPLVLNRSNLILRGEGMDQTVLVIPKSLEAIEGSKSVDDTKSAYSFSGGFVQIKGSDAGRKITDVVGRAARGDRELQVKDAANINAGDWVRLLIKYNDEPATFLLGGLKPGEQTFKDAKNCVDFAACVIERKGDRIRIDRPLRVDVRPEWQAEIWAFQPRVEQCGIEHLSFEFPGVPKRPHLKEEGFNSIWITNAANCWVRNVSITDADNGVIVHRSRFCTIENTTFREKKRNRPTGHHALWATGFSQDCLFTDFVIETEYVHDLTVEGFANGNVFTRGRGVAINMDHHRNSPYDNLFTEIDMGNPRRIWSSSGRTDRGPHSGRYETFWSLRWSGRPPKLPDWPLMNVINLPGYTEQRDPNGTWVESDNDSLPKNLYEAQRARRLGPAPRPQH